MAGARRSCRGVTQDGKNFTVSAPNEEEAQKAVQRKIARLRRDGHEVEAVEPSRHERIEHPEVRFEVKIDTTIRVRVAAKIALGILSKILPDAWLDTPDAKRLQGWLWDEKPKTIDGARGAAAAPISVDEDLGLICRPPEHLIFFLAAGDDAMNLIVVRFGHEVLPIRIDLAGSPRPRTAWALDPKAWTVTETTFDQLVVRALPDLAGGALT